MPRYHNTPENFWSSVDRSSPDSCWLWQGSYSKHNGYGQISWGGRPRQTHRLAWELTYGPIPEGLIIRHSCDTPLCCNPAHLILGTQLENVEDRVNRNRSRGLAGEANNSAKLNDARVAYIREQYNDGALSQRELAEMFGVSIGQISRIVRGKAWWSIF